MLKIVEDEIKVIAKRIISLTFYNAKKEDCLDNPYFIAYEILDLTQWMCENYSVNHFVTKEILKCDTISDKTKQIIRELS
ncbi:MAG: hypothetical protein Q7R33_10225 [Nitrosarchaeum sp.]|nr:hypothetical protein [Nitrosarchaeum sp.]